MRYKLEITRQYLKDLRLARKRQLDENKLNEIILKLLKGEPLPIANRDHALKGDYKDCRECHITPDWLLIYSVKTSVKVITLIRTGSHSDLF